MGVEANKPLSGWPHPYATFKFEDETFRVNFCFSLPTLNSELKTEN